MYSLFDVIFFTESLTSNPRFETLADTISLTDGVSSSIISIPFRDGINPVDDIIGNYVKYVTFGDGISWYEYTHPRSHVVGFEDFLYLPDWFDRLPKNLYDTITFSDSMVGDKGGFHDSMPCTDSFTYDHVVLRPLVDSLSLADGMPHYILDPWRV